MKTVTPVRPLQYQWSPRPIPPVNVPQPRHTKRNSVEAILIRALDKLETYGWTTGTLGNERDGYCLLGAIKASTHLRLFNQRGERRAIELVEHIIVSSRSSWGWAGADADPSRVITRWNDFPHRTYADVKARLGWAIELAGERGL